MPIDFMAAMNEDKTPPAQEEVERAVEGADRPAPQALILLDVNLVKPGFKEYLAEIDRWEDALKKLEVKDDESATTAAVIGGEAAKALKAIKKHRDEVTHDARSFIAGLDGFLDSFNNRLKSIKGIADQKISDLKYRQRIEEQKQKAAAEAAARELQAKLDREAEEANRKLREEEARRVNEEAERKAREAGTAPPAEVKADQIQLRLEVKAPQVVAPVIPQTKTQIKTDTGVTAFGKEPWICEIKKPEKVPRQYCLPSQKLLNDAVKEGMREIDGCDIRQKYKTQFRTQ